MCSQSIMQYQLVARNCSENPTSFKTIMPFLLLMYSKFGINMHLDLTRNARYNPSYSQQPNSSRTMCRIAPLFLSYFILSISLNFPLLIPYSYSLLLHCWDGQPEKRPSFRELVVTIATMMEAIGVYLSLNVTDRISLAPDTNLLYYNLDTAIQTKEFELCLHSLIQVATMFM